MIKETTQMLSLEDAQTEGRAVATLAETNATERFGRREILQSDYVFAASMLENSQKLMGIEPALLIESQNKLADIRNLLPLELAKRFISLMEIAISFHRNKVSAAFQTYFDSKKEDAGIEFDDALLATTIMDEIGMSEKFQLLTQTYPELPKLGREYLSLLIKLALQSGLSVGTP